MRRESSCREALFAELALARGADARLDAEVASLSRELDVDGEELESRARWLSERLAIALQASILLRGGNPAIASGFCASRLGERRGLAFGTLIPSLARTALLKRALPA